MWSGKNPMFRRFSLKFSKLNTVQWIFITFLAFILLSFRTVQLPNIFVSSSKPNQTRRAWRTCLCDIVVIHHAKKRGDQSHDCQALCTFACHFEKLCATYMQSDTKKAANKAKKTTAKAKKTTAKKSTVATKKVSKAKKTAKKKSAPRKKGTPVKEM